MGIALYPADSNACCTAPLASGHRAIIEPPPPPPVSKPCGAAGAPAPRPPAGPRRRRGPQIPLRSLILASMVCTKLSFEMYLSYLTRVVMSFSWSCCSSKRKPATAVALCLEENNHGLVPYPYISKTNFTYDDALYRN